MTFAAIPHRAPARSAGAAFRTARPVSPLLARGLLAAAVLAAVIGGYVSTDPGSSAQAIARAGEDLTRLLRAMAAIKAVMATAVLAGLWWRMATPTPPGRLAAYVAAGAAMSAGPVMIWDMARVATGALALHAGLIVALVVLWRDPDVTGRIAGMIGARRRSLAANPSSVAIETRDEAP